MRYIFRKRLERYLEIAPDEAFVQLMWAANAIQSGHPESALKFLQNVPRDAITTDIGSRAFLYKWELETLFNELMRIPKRMKPVRGRWRELDCTRYDTFRTIVGIIRKLADVEAVIRLRRINVLDEMPRMFAPQFDWQRGWFNIAQFYRTAYIYGQGACAEYFEATHGLTINEFSLIGFSLHISFWQNPIVLRSFDWRQMPITSEKFDNALRLLCLPTANARQQAHKIHRSFQPIAYQPSILRQYPCVSFGESNERIRAPLPQLIIERITGGVFYDIIGAGGKVLDEYGRRFEDYSLRYLKASLPGINWQPEHSYKVNKVKLDSPDILWASEGKLSLAVECKSTRLSVEARFNDNPLSVRGYEDLIKAVFQLWRYFSHCRRGFTNISLCANVVGVVLTLDSWVTMASTLIHDIFKAAKRMAAEKDQNITEDDCKPILFCPISDLEYTLAYASEESFRTAIDLAIKEKIPGSLLSSSHDKVRPPNAEEKEFPFRDDVGRLLPWWDWVERQ